MIWIVATQMELTTYITNLVSLIGLGIAIDYSLLDRLPLPRGAARDGRHATTRSCGRWTRPGAPSSSPGRRWRSVSRCSSSCRCPFMRGFGVGGLLIPAVSVIAAVTFLPVVLSLVGRRLDRVRLLPRTLARAAGRPRARLLGTARAHGSCGVRGRSRSARPPSCSLLPLPVLDTRGRAGTNDGHPAGARERAGPRHPRRRRSEPARPRRSNVVIDTGRAGRRRRRRRSRRRSSGCARGLEADPAGRARRLPAGDRRSTSTRPAAT